ncbi:MAG: phosphate ABC transporter substrate-binding protein PstS, partial [Phycisphaerales bacterium]|nr:phosphate ABC transporter substrate-binding protein PstS [Phycisphaerales bacterium]
MFSRIGKLLKVAVPALALAVVGGNIARGVEISGAGSTFVYPIMLKWMALYEKSHPDVKIDYEAIGSGGGINGLINKTIDFSGSDAYMSKSQMKQAGGVLHMPELAGPEVMSYNLPMVHHQLVFDGKVIADIYLGRITKWNDPRIEKLNPGVKLPNLHILVAHRSDGSGTTFIFTGYLCKVSPSWKTQVGQATSVNWPVGRGGKGNPGVAALIDKTKGGLGYLEYAYAIEGHFPVAKLINKDGYAIQPSMPSVIAAQKAIVANLPSDLRLRIINPSGKKAYPISGFTYLILAKDLGYMSHAKAEATVKFIHWILTKGQNYAKELQYIRLGPAMQKQVLTN